MPTKARGNQPSSRCNYKYLKPLLVQVPLMTGELKDVLAGRTEDEEAMCAVCSGGLSVAPNLIVFCERCDIAVHQRCYGVDDIPAGLLALCTFCNL